ncbi:MAG: alpha/beta fold hydrolase [Deltaproteobacteria bacterium]|nr:alpha/beta fold hydrolase [Deltaproteobacteria bacterium]
MEERFFFDGPGEVKLAAALHRPEEPAALGVVICHGMLSSKDSAKHVGIAARLCEMGYAVLRFDFQGRGESAGDLLGLTFTRQVNECRSAIRELRQRTDVERVALVGSSMGAAVAILVAGTAGEGIAGLVSLAALARTDRLAERIAGPKGLAAWRRKGWLRLESEPVGYSLVEDGERVEVLAAAGRVVCPWLILHGEEDEIVPAEDARALWAASEGRAELEIVLGADHRFSAPDALAHITDQAVGFLRAALG